MLGDEHHAGAQRDPVGDGGGLGERHERVESAAVLRRQRVADGRRGAAALRNVGVLGEKEPGEAALLQLVGEPDRADRLVGEEDRGGDPHRGGTSVVAWEHGRPWRPIRDPRQTACSPPSATWGYDTVDGGDRTAARHVSNLQATRKGHA
ncbi:hypothetical protein GCM10020000_46730 [Streptomyces olivoverticillatus]